MSEQKIYSVHMGKAKCAVDLGDGSERGGYVGQDYILRKLGRPHRGINLMYCYYPLDKGWPERARVAFPSTDSTNAWGYPYDDYFPYRGGLQGDKNAEAFEQMRDIRRHGQDVIFTLTIDPHVSDEHLIAIAEDLRPFGRVLMRINHEATGSWFSFNKRCSYKEVADFFTRFAKIIHKHAPNVKTILCAGCVERHTQGKLEMEELFLEAAKETDIWSLDKYFTLHYGYPNDIAEKGSGTYTYNGNGPVWDSAKATVERYREVTGQDKPLVMSELNTDGDVTGPYDQAKMVRAFCDRIVNEKAEWLSAFTFYQFRDRGRLGLEWEDPNDPNVGVELPMLKEYKEIISQDWFKPEMTLGEEIKLPARLRWGGAEDAEGIALPIHFESDPVFCELSFNGNDNLMMELNGMWFYKAPGTKFVDLMPAFFENRLGGETDLTLKIFAPPASGENDVSGSVDNYSVISELPAVRIRYEPVQPFTY